MDACVFIDTKLDPHVSLYDGTTPAVLMAGGGLLTPTMDGALPEATVRGSMFVLSIMLRMMGLYDATTPAIDGADDGHVYTDPIVDPTSQLAAVFMGATYICQPGITS